MIINNFDQSRATISPRKTDAILVIEANAMLPKSITSQGFKAVARWYSQLIEPRYGVQLVKFAACDTPHGFRTRLACIFGIRAVEDVFSSSLFERLDHTTMIAWKEAELKRDRPTA